MSTRLAQEALGGSRTGPASPRRLPRFLRTWPARVALSTIVLLLGIAFLGRFLAPHSPTALVGGPYQPPGDGFWLGTDYLGEDVLSRVLYGGRNTILFAVISTSIAYVIGGFIGLLAGFSRSLVDPVLMRSVDLLLAFPALFLILLLATRFGTNPATVVAGIALIHIPQIARIIRTATLEASVKGYVEAAIARADSTLSILRRQILPNITGPLVADAGPRLTVSILLVASLDFLGIGVAPPTPDWALMINENGAGISLNAWPLVIPAALIAALTISVNVVADAFARSRGHSVEETFTR
jgi:peptide/nickel transport system permease protein